MPILVTFALSACVAASPDVPLEKGTPLSNYRTFEVRATVDDTGRALPSAVTERMTERLRQRLVERGIGVFRRAGANSGVAVLRPSLIYYDAPGASTSGRQARAIGEAIAKVSVLDKPTGRQVISFAVTATSGRPGAEAIVEPAGANVIDDAATLLAEAIARAFGGNPPSASAERQTRDRFEIRGSTYVHDGHGVFTADGHGQDSESAQSNGRRISLVQIKHSHDLAIDTDVTPFTNVTLNDRVRSLVDDGGRRYALITLYNIDPPLSDLPSAELGIDRGMDFRDPANLVKGAYSNYVSPVFTDDERPRPVAGHPIGHFLVKAQIPGYPTILAGMTTIKRADDELVDLTLGQQLGIGGVLLTPQPGRLNSAAEALEELSRRQSRLIVTDGRHYRNVRGRNVGPTFVIEDGNVTFARFKIPVDNAGDALRFFLEYIDRDVQSRFGSIISRPHKGTGAGCSAFAFAWLKAAGIVPFVAEPQSDETKDAISDPTGPEHFWNTVYRRLHIPWAHVGCDQRIGARGPQSADLTVYDLLFYDETTKDIVEASQGLVNTIRKDIGPLGATLFQFGAFTPLRDFLITSLRKDPKDLGNYRWGTQDTGLAVGFWDNRLFSDWIKALWTIQTPPDGIELVREGRFYGVQVDAMDAPRQAGDFFKKADEIAEKRSRLKARGVVPTSCEAVFALGLQ